MSTRTLSVRIPIELYHDFESYAKEKFNGDKREAFESVFSPFLKGNLILKKELEQANEKYQKRLNRMNGKRQKELEEKDEKIQKITEEYNKQLEQLKQGKEGYDAFLTHVQPIIERYKRKGTEEQAWKRLIEEIDFASRLFKHRNEVIYTRDYPDVGERILVPCPEYNVFVDRELDCHNCGWKDTCVMNVAGEMIKQAENDRKIIMKV